MEKLIFSTLDEISKLKKTDLRSLTLINLTSSCELNTKTNGYWLSYINNQLQNKDSMNDVKTYQVAMDNVTPESIKET